jgi:hypothetical protein
MKTLLTLSMTVALTLLSTESPAEEGGSSDGILHVFYGLTIVKDGNAVANVRTSQDVILATPIEVNFEGRCQVSLLFNAGQTGRFTLILALRELTQGVEDSFTLPVNHTYMLGLDEELQFSIQTNSGLILNGSLELKKVSRLEVAT